MDIGLIGGIIGGTLGIAGGAVGTYFSIKNTAGPKERSFMFRVSAIAWIFVTAFLVGLFLVPNPFKWLLWIPYGIALPLGILWLNRRQQQIRKAEAAARASGPSPV
ncbi:MAG: hypothetical protein ACREVG_06735 [Burkholderiales bacterium]